MRGAVLCPAPRLRPRAVRLGAAEEERELRAVPELAQAPHQPRQLRRPAQVILLKKRKNIFIKGKYSSQVGEYLLILYGHKNI